jgi:hypothetical protein
MAIGNVHTASRSTAYNIVLMDFPGMVIRFKTTAYIHVLHAGIIIKQISNNNHNSLSTNTSCNINTQTNEAQSHANFWAGLKFGMNSRANIHHHHLKISKCPEFNGKQINSIIKHPSTQI